MRELRIQPRTGRSRGTSALGWDTEVVNRRSRHVAVVALTMGVLALVACSTGSAKERASTDLINRLEELKVEFSQVLKSSEGESDFADGVRGMPDLRSTSPETDVGSEGYYTLEVSQGSVSLEVVAKGVTGPAGLGSGATVYGCAIFSGHIGDSEVEARATACPEILVERANLAAYPEIVVEFG